MRQLTIYIAVVLSMLVACRAEPKGLLTPKQTQKVLWDILKVDAFTKDYILKDSTKDALLENTKMQMQIFAMHKVTKEQFYSSFEYYKTKPEVFNAIMDSITNSASLEKYTEYNKYKAKTPLDTVNNIVTPPAALEK